jgi:hypothetical protein
VINPRRRYDRRILRTPDICGLYRTGSSRAVGRGWHAGRQYHNFVIFRFIVPQMGAEWNADPGFATVPWLTAATSGYSVDSTAAGDHLQPDPGGRQYRNSMIFSLYRTANGRRLER